MSNVTKEKSKTVAKADKPKNKKAKGAKPKVGRSPKKAKERGNDDIGNDFDSAKLGADIVKFRFDSQISQQNFADSMGISKTMVYDMEIGGNPTAKTLAKVLPAIDKTFDRYIIKRKIVAG